MKTRNVVFGSIEDCRKYLRYAESFPYDLDLCYGSRVVDGKSILGDSELWHDEKTGTGAAYGGMLRDRGIP